MKIAILIDKMYPGATPKFSGSEAKYLNEAGHHAEIITLMEGGIDSESFQYKEFLSEVEVTSLTENMKIKGILKKKIPGFSFMSLFHLLSPVYAPLMIRWGRYDVIIAYNCLTCITAYSIKIFSGIPYIAQMWDPLSYIFEKVYKEKLPPIIYKIGFSILKIVDRTIANGSDLTISLSEEHARYLKSINVKKPVIILYAGCMPEKKIPKKRGDYLLAIDRWDIGNKPHILLEVVERLNDKNVELVISGFWEEDWLRDEFIYLVKEKGLENQITLKPPVTEVELRGLFRGARAYLHPIEETSVSMPALEAAAAGCPVVIPKGTPLFTQGETAFFPGEGDIDEYARYVEMLVSDERLAYMMGKAAWKMAKENSWRVHGEKLESYLKEFF